MSRPLALITGGTSGIGLGIAKKLAATCDLALVYVQNSARAEASLNELKASFPDGKFQIFQKELTGEQSCIELYQDVVAGFQRAPAILANCAGRLNDGLFLGSSFSQHQKLIEEHLFVTMALSQLCAKDMSKARFGRIINLSSISARFSKRGQTSYAAAKAAIEAFTRTLALEVAHRGVTVNAIAPGLIETPMTEQFIQSLEQSETPLRKRIPVGRLGSAEEVGALAAFLASADSAYITGTVLTIDGGRSLGDMSV